jgi:hypothetical protein
MATLINDYIAALTQDTSPTSDDIVLVIDDPGGGKSPKKVSLADLIKGMISSVASGQLVYRASGGVLGAAGLALSGGGVLEASRTVKGSLIQRVPAKAIQTVYRSHEKIAQAVAALHQVSPSGLTGRTTPSGTFPGSGAFMGGVLLPDGRVFCVPCNSTAARIYDPATDTLTTPSGT